MGNKGLCIDRVTFQDCPRKIPAAWPNTEHQPVASIRLYQPWHPSWGSNFKRTMAWSSLVSWVKANNVQVLLGTEVTCDSAADDEMWFWTIELMKMLGKEHVMGISIGNEMDAFHSSRSWAETDCNDDLWNGGYWKTLQRHVMDMDLNGFVDTKVTAAWSLAMLGSPGSPDRPFKEDHLAKASTLVKSAAEKWPGRWVWTFNVISLFDSSLRPTSPEDCAQSTAEAVGLGPMRRALREIRRRIKLITGRDDDVVWVGEGGWSSHGPDSLKEAVDICPEFASEGALGDAYRSFLEWDLSLGNGMKAADHAFFYSIRDDPKRGGAFGLIEDCTGDSCKVQPDTMSALEVKMV